MWLHVEIITLGGHFLEVGDGELRHLLQIVNKAHPLLDLLHEVPRGREVQHDHENCAFQQCGRGKLAVDGWVFDFLHHIDF